MQNMETTETHSQPCDDNAKHHQPKHHSFLPVKTTSDATLDDGSGKRWFDAGTTWRKNWIWESSAMMLSNDYSWRCIVSMFQSLNYQSVCSKINVKIQKNILNSFKSFLNPSAKVTRDIILNFRQGNFWSGELTSFLSGLDSDWMDWSQDNPQQDNPNKST